MNASLSESLFPLRFFNINIESVGPSLSGTQKNLGLNKCFVSAYQLNCSTEKKKLISDLISFRVDQKYRISLLDNSNHSIGRHISYETLLDGMTPSCNNADAKKCYVRALYTERIDDIPYLTDESENKNHLLDSKFSLLKQEEMDSLRFKYQVKGNMKREVLIVPLQ